ECESIEDVRAEIDRQVIALIGKRAEYVRAAAKFKTSEADVKATGRFETMLDQRCVWATEEDISPDMIEKLYRDIVQYFVREEMAHWKQTRR
ncbi:MAG: isochorismate-pyruvate lyase, partial [Chloroflexi bacterium]|nr:isochorismate-pyruvate lyase [Chloroflexota bacterium]